MPVILSLETSTDVCSVALNDQRTVLGTAEIHEPQSHAARLAPMIEQVSREAKVALTDISAVAVASGPGSYTGLRIGVSTAKGLCYGLSVPLITVSTLELLAFQGRAFNSVEGLLCPMIDARRMEVYNLVADNELRIIQEIGARVIEQETFLELLTSQKVLFFGNGSLKCKEVIHHPNAFFLDNIFPQAASLGEMAQKKFSAGEFEDLMAFTPIYLKEFVPKKAGTGK
jgi:tRNA threonylcarbamoyladenosine biosynthesis protein TsaB